MKYHEVHLQNVAIPAKWQPPENDENSGSTEIEDSNNFLCVKIVSVKRPFWAKMAILWVF